MPWSSDHRAVFLASVLFCAISSTLGDCPRGRKNTTDCIAVCDEGTYGMNCLKTCHCPADDVCNAVNGLCVSGQCDVHWTGPSCQIEKPILEEPPEIEARTATNITLQWDRWVSTQTVDSFNITIASYHVEYQSNTSEIRRWNRATSVSATPNAPSYTYVVRGLAPFQEYRFRLTLGWWSYDKVVDSLPGTPTDWVHTLCTFPGDGPEILNTSVNVNQSCITISWAEPMVSSCEAIISYMVYVYCETLCEEHFEHVSNMTTLSTTMCNLPSRLMVSVRAYNNELFPSPLSNTVQVLDSVPVGFTNFTPPVPSVAPVIGKHIVHVRIQPQPAQPLPRELILIERTDSSLTFRAALAGRSDIPENYMLYFELLVTVSLTMAYNHQQSPKLQTDSLLLITNLHPATMYNITMISRTISGSSMSVVAWTTPSIPPTPNPPVILNMSNHAVLVELALSSGGYDSITRHLLIMEYIKNGTSQISQVLNVSEGNFITEYDTKVAMSTGELYDKPYNLVNYKTAMAQGLPYYITAEILDLTTRKFTVGDGNVYSEYYNQPLASNTEYNLWYMVVRSLDGAVASSLSSVSFKTGNFVAAASAVQNKNNIPIVIGSLVGFAVLLIFVVAAFVAIWYRRRQNLFYADTWTSYHHGETISQKSNGNNSNIHHVGTNASDMIDTSNIDSGIKIRASRPEFTEGYRIIKKSSPVVAKKLRRYIDRRENSDFPLADEFKSLPRSSVDECNIAMQPENINYNRSSFVMPFDKNRIDLIKLSPDDNSYINASFVQSVSNREYIVTQCPLETTTGEFWRMIWEQDIQVIVMLIAFKEQGRVEYDRYWPQRCHQPYVYHNMEVVKVREECSAHYTIRQLHVSQISSGETRSITHWQYVSWFSGGIPTHTIPFLDFTCRIQEEHCGKMAVHCHTGGGRSGLFVALDSMLIKGQQTGKVDILQCVTKLRSERMHLVKTFKQYKFLHECLAESFDHSETRIPIDRFMFAFDNIIDVEGHKGYSVLDREYMSLPYSHRPTLGQQPRSFRDYSVFASPVSLTSDTLLSSMISVPEPDIPSSTVSLDSYLHQNLFFITDPPLAAEVADFWNMVMEVGSHLVVLLNTSSDCPSPYWPSERMTYGQLDIHHLITSNPNKHYFVHEISVTYNCKTQGSRKRFVKVYELLSWLSDVDTPSVPVILGLVNDVRDSHMKARTPRPVVVQSSCGGHHTRAALFCLAWTLLERLDHCLVVDIFSQTRLVRDHISRAVSSLEQYRFLYRMVKTVLMYQDHENSANQTRLLPAYNTPV